LVLAVDIGLRAGKVCFSLCVEVGKIGKQKGQEFQRHEYPRPFHSRSSLVV